MVFCNAGHQAMRRSLAPGAKGLGFDDDLALRAGGKVGELKARPRPLGLKLLGLEPQEAREAL
jgi:hypothetical protein